MHTIPSRFLDFTLAYLLDQGGERFNQRETRVTDLSGIRMSGNLPYSIHVTEYAKTRVACIIFALPVSKRFFCVQELAGKCQLLARDLFLQRLPMSIHNSRK